MLSGQDSESGSFRAATGRGWTTNAFDHLAGGAFGLGLDRVLYNFVCTNYVDGDAIILIGYSRGAFTARSLADLITSIGLLTPEGLDHLCAVFDDYENMGTETAQLGFTRNTYHDGVTDIKIKAVAVWDTVGALGIPPAPIIGIRGSAEQSDCTWVFTNIKISNKVENAFQALALDESRHAFRPSLWERLPDSTTNLKQVWFPGSHGNVLTAPDLSGMCDQLSTLGPDDACPWSCRALLRPRAEDGCSYPPPTSSPSSVDVDGGGGGGWKLERGPALSEAEEKAARDALEKGPRELRLPGSAIAGEYYPAEGLYPGKEDDHHWRWVWEGKVEGEDCRRVPQVLVLPEESLVGYWERYLLGLTAGEPDVWNEPAASREKGGDMKKEDHLALSGLLVDPLTWLTEVSPPGSPGAPGSYCAADEAAPNILGASPCSSLFDCVKSDLECGVSLFDNHDEDPRSDESSIAWLFLPDKDEEEEGGQRRDAQAHAAANSDGIWDWYADEIRSRRSSEQVPCEGSSECEKMGEDESPLSGDSTPESPPAAAPEEPDPDDGNAEEPREYVGVGLAPPVVFPLKRERLPVFKRAYIFASFENKERLRPM
ncbi:hypothetical protein VTG60DRAFT_1402 [Thermothelomyces hinnuleus]